MTSICKKLRVAALLLQAAALTYAQTTKQYLPTMAGDEVHQWVEETLAGMSVEEKVGQLIVTTVVAKSDSTNLQHARKLAEKYKVGGVLFGDGTVAAEVKLTNILQGHAKVPVLVTFDGEWGLSMRLKETPDYPRNSALGCITDNALIEAYGREVARQMQELGVHVNFAPDADVNTNPQNPVIHIRSFGEKPERVAEKVLAYSRGLEAGGVLSVSKHFPGHGDTNTDSHKALPTLLHNRARLDSIELMPFRAAIQAGLGGIMVGHLQVPALEPDGVTPSSLSRNIVTGLLKEELGFRGLIFTDALDMKGVSGVPQLNTKALLAGNDMILVQYNTKNAVQELLQAVKSGKLPMEVVEEKCRKILTVKYLLGLNKQPQPLDEATMMSRINTPEAQALAAKLRKASVTVLRTPADAATLVPASSNVALLRIGKENTCKAFEAELKQMQPGLTTYYLPWQADAARQKQIAKQLAAYEQVIVCVSDVRSKVGEADGRFLAGLKLKQAPTYVFFTSYRPLQSVEKALEQAGGVVLAHADESDLQQHVAKVLYGLEKADGQLSMSIGKLFPAE